MDGWMDGDGCNWKSIFYPSPRWIIVAIICSVSNNGGRDGGHFLTSFLSCYPRTRDSPLQVFRSGRERWRCTRVCALLSKNLRILDIMLSRKWSSWAMISVLPLPSSFDGEKKIVSNQTETGTGEPRIVRDIQMHTHTERLTLTKATTFSFITFRSNFYRDISRNDNKGCVKPFGFDAKNKYACHTTKCLESFLDKYISKNVRRGWEGSVIPLSKNLFLYPIIIINYRSTVLRTFRYTVWRTKRR